MLSGNTELEEFGDGGREAESKSSVYEGLLRGMSHNSLLEEQVLIVGVGLSPLLEGLVRDEDVVGREHHERVRRFVLELLRAVPLLPDPLLVQEQLEVLIRHARRRERPRPVVPRPVGVAAPQRVPAEQRDDLLVVEAVWETGGGRGSQSAPASPTRRSALSGGNGRTPCGRKSETRRALVSAGQPYAASSTYGSDVVGALRSVR